MEQSREILSTAPLGLFYHGLSLEEENLTNVLCEVINKLLGPFSYTDIVSPENKVDQIRKKKKKKTKLISKLALIDRGIDTLQYTNSTFISTASIQMFGIE
jgi:hypothetical protein